MSEKGVVLSKMCYVRNKGCSRVEWLNLTNVNNLVLSLIARKSSVIVYTLLYIRAFRARKLKGFLSDLV